MNGLETLLQGLFDYAGTFPPAALPLEAALKESAGFHKSLHRPSLVGADLVLDQANLQRVDAKALAAAGFGPGRPVRICLVGVPVDDSPAVAEAMWLFSSDREASAVPHRLVTLETVVEAPIAPQAKELETTLDRARKAAGPDLRLYLEAKWGRDGWDAYGEDFRRLLERLNSRRNEPRIGLKVRMAGKLAIDHAVATELIVWASAREIPLKATQGLHHALAGQPAGNEWGFLNLAAALRLHKVLGRDRFTRDAIGQCLRATDAKAFQFQDGLGWGGHRVTMPHLELAVRRVPFSIGSCDLQEPDRELKALFG